MKKNIDLQEATMRAMLNGTKIEEDVTPDREYQGIKYFDNQDGWCPICNAHLHYEPVEYGGQNENGDSVSYCSWTCDKCGTRGEAYFKQSFIGHSVYDDNWDLIDLPFGEPKTESKKTEAKLEDIQMEIYEMIQTARKVDKQDKDTNKRETAYAIMQEYPEINRKELINYISKKADEIYAGEYDEKTESLSQQDIIQYKGYVAEVDEPNYDNENETIVTIYKSMKDYKNGDYLENISLKNDNLEEYIKSYIDDTYGKVTESKKVEAIDKEKVLNMKYSDLPDICYGLLPSDKSIIIIKKGENGYYETDFDDIEDTEEFVNRENSKMGVTPEQRMVMELRSMSGNWKLKNEESKKVEDVEKLNNMYEQGTTELEKAFTTEVKYWLQALIDDNPNDAVGVQALNVIDNEAKIKEIVDELVNGSDDLWEEIHLKIEQLAGIDYKNSTRGKIESKQIKTEDEDEEAPVVVEYWETEDDRDNGMGEIYEYYSENDIDNAIAVAKRILDKNNFASVEVWNTKTERSYYWSDGKDEKYFKV